MSGAGGNFISDKFKRFCQNVNTEQAASPSYHHQSSRQVEECIIFIICNIKKCIHIRSHVDIALLQVGSTPLVPGLPSPTTLLFNHPIRGIIPIINKHYEVLVKRQTKKDKNHDTSRNYTSFLLGSTVVVQ